MISIKQVFTFEPEYQVTDGKGKPNKCTIKELETITIGRRYGARQQPMEKDGLQTLGQDSNQH